MRRGADSKPLKPKVKNLVNGTHNREATERSWLLAEKKECCQC